MDPTVLRKLGLTESQSKAYLSLLEYGPLTPAQVAEKTGETRTNAYAITDRLAELGLAAKSSQHKSAYRAESPAKLKQLLIQKQRALKTAAEELNGFLPRLLSMYTLSSDKPGVLYLEGIDSLRLIYDDVIKTGETLRVIPSTYDREDSEISDMIDKQIKRQTRAGIKTEVLIRREVFNQFAESNQSLFEARPADFGALEAQILLYGDNTAMTTFRNGVISTVITSPLITNTLKQLFETLWILGAASDT